MINSGDNDPSKCTSWKLLETVLSHLKEVDGELFPIPKRSGDLNPIENVFNVAKEELQTQAMRVLRSLQEELKVHCIQCQGKQLTTIASIFKRLDLITKNRGRRTKY